MATAQAAPLVGVAPPLNPETDDPLSLKEAFAPVKE